MMAENRLRVMMTYRDRGDGGWSDQIERCREFDLERLEQDEEAHPDGERLDAGEIASLLDDATGGFGSAFRLMATDYVSIFDDLVSTMLRIPLGLELLEYRGSVDYFEESDLIYATMSERTATALLKRSAKGRHHALQTQLSFNQDRLRSLIEKPIAQWSAHHLGVLLASLIEDVEKIERDVFIAMAEGSDCFYADSAIDWNVYEAAAEQLRRAKREDGDGGRGAYRGNSFSLFIPRGIRLTLHSYSLKHPCEAASAAEIEAFDALASGGEPRRSGDAISSLVRRGFLKPTGWKLEPGGADGQLTRHRYTVPIALHLAWCEWALATSFAPRIRSAVPTATTSDQLSLFAEK